MFTAIDELGNKISITNAEYGKNYYCPICQEKLIVKKKGKVKIPHFAHKPGSDCTDWGDMSEWHLNWQEKFPEDYREVVLKKDGEQHRADICIKDKNLIIEFQHSHISNEEFNRRNHFYISCGYQLIWVFDATGKIKDPNAYAIPPYLNGRVFCQNDYFTQELEWKRKQDTFRNFPEFLRKIGTGKIAIYLETQIDAYQDKNILIGIKQMNEKYITAYYTSQYIFQENFLKTNGGFVEESCRSISEILEETKKIQSEIQCETQRRNNEQQQQLANKILFGNFRRRRW